MLLPEERDDLERDTALASDRGERERLETLLLLVGFRREAGARRPIVDDLPVVRRVTVVLRSPRVGVRRRSRVTALPRVFAVVREPV